MTRVWSRWLCTGGRDGLLRRLPERFALIDRSRLDLLRNHITVGWENQYDQIKGLDLQPGVAAIGCDNQSKFCTALEVDGERRRWG